MLFLAMYLVTVVGNTLIVLAIGLDPYLHTPMYLFLANLSLADIASISTSVPKMLMNIQTKSPSISYESCITQMYFSIVFVVTDNFLLGVMACDRFVAICHPLNYTTIMEPGLCLWLAATPWALSNAVALAHTLLLLRSAFSDGSAPPHFFCDLARCSGCPARTRRSASSCSLSWAHRSPPCPSPSSSSPMPASPGLS